MQPTPLLLLIVISYSEYKLLSHIVIYVLYVFVFFNAFDEFVNGCHLLFVESFSVVRDTHEFRRSDFVTIILEIFLDR